MAAPAPEALARRASEELRAATGPGIDPEIREDYLRLLRAAPSALLREGAARDHEGGKLHLTVSAVILDDALARTVLVFHRKAGVWVQPGGHIEAADASLEAVARREALEETGLADLERVGDGPALLIPHGPADTFGSCGSHWDAVFALRTLGAQPALHPEAGSDAVWAPLTDLPPGTAEDIAPLLADVQAALGL